MRFIEVTASNGVFVARTEDGELYERNEDRVWSRVNLDYDSASLGQGKVVETNIPRKLKRKTSGAVPAKSPSQDMMEWTMKYGQD